MSKKKAAANKGKGKGGTKEEDDDWDLILNAEVAANQVLLSETKPPAEEPAANATSKSDTAVRLIVDTYVSIYSLMSVILHRPKKRKMTMMTTMMQMEMETAELVIKR